jgi:hypothetical protein
MAQTYHLKEIIELETDDPFLKLLRDCPGNKGESKMSTITIGRPALNEVAIWNAALQFECPMNQYGNTH